MLKASFSSCEGGNEPASGATELQGFARCERGKRSSKEYQRPHYQRVKPSAKRKARKHEPKRANLPGALLLADDSIGQRKRAKRKQRSQELELHCGS